MQRQDRTCRCRQVPPFRKDDAIEIWNDGAEHPESPRFVSWGDGSRHPSQQQKARYFGRRYPGSDAALGFIVEEPFSPKCGVLTVAERGGPCRPVCRSKSPQSGQVIRQPRNWLRRAGTVRGWPEAG